MKNSIKLVSSLAIICFSLFLSSCQNPTVTDPGNVSSKYAVYKNFNQFPSKRIIPKAGTQLQDGEPIVGVLLKFTSEGAYDTEVYPRDANTFAIYCLFDEHGLDGDGMEFNYVLYVPQDIQDQYRAGGGANPSSGDPFWWYMKTYFGASLQVIKGDWAPNIEFLCGLTECPKANSADVATSTTTIQNVDQYTVWQDNIGSDCKVSNINAFINSANESQFVVSYDYEITDERSTMTYNPPLSDIFRITGPKLSPGKGTIAYIIPIEKITSKQDINTELYLPESNPWNSYCVGITLSWAVSDVKKSSIPDGAIIAE